MKPYCKKLQDLLAADGPGAIRDDERAQSHLVDCTDCFAFLETLGELEGQLRALPLVDVSDTVVDELLARPEIALVAPESTRAARKGLLDRSWPWLERNRRPGPLVWATGAAVTVALWAAFAVYLTGHGHDIRRPFAPAESITVRKYVPPPPKVERRQVKQQKPTRRVPVPDPTPDEPEPIRDPERQVGQSQPDLEYLVGTPDTPPPPAPASRKPLPANVQVVAKGDVIEREAAETAYRFSEDFTSDLPTPGRFYQNVLTMAPGVNDARDANVHGSRDRDFAAMVGGVRNVDPLAGGFISQINPNSIEEIEAITSDAARQFVAERAALEGLSFKEAAGYWANTYVPGDPALRLLRWRLQQVNRSAILPAVDEHVLLHDGSRSPAQPFDPSSDSALAVFLNADRSNLDKEGRMLLQVGLQGASRHGGSRPAMNLGVVLDLRGEIPVNVAASMRALLEALNEAKQPGDRFRVVIAGRPGAMVVEPADFRHGYLAVTMEGLLDEESQPDGIALELDEAAATAIHEVAEADDPSMPLGSSAVLLVTHQAFGDRTDVLADMAHQSAVAGVPVSVVAIGDGASLKQVDRIVLSGQGNRRLLGSAADAAGLIARELDAASRVIARAVRLRIRLAPGVRLVDVVGSSRLNETVSHRVREAEKSIDLRLARNLGIEADRGKDEEGIQIVIPNFYAGDRHFILLDVVAGGPGPVAEVTARYKDLIFLRNGIARANLTLPAGEAAAGPLERGVLRSYLAQQLHETMDQAGVALTEGDQEKAFELLTEFRGLLEGLRESVSGFERDADLARDIAMLDEYRSILGGSGIVEGIQIAYLSDSLRYAAWLKVLSPYAADRGDTP